MTPHLLTNSRPATEANIMVPTIFWYWKDFQGPWSCIFKDQFSTEVYSMDSSTATFNIYFCDYVTALVAKNKKKY